MSLGEHDSDVKIFLIRPCVYSWLLLAVMALLGCSQKGCKDQPDHPQGGTGSTGPVAPPLDRSVTTSIAEATKFLYTGANAIQQEVAPGAIDPLRVAVLRGRVSDLAGKPLGGIKVRALAWIIHG
jgi:hypothetical protein